MKWVEFVLIYSAQKMEQYGYWKRQRGLARSNNVEHLLLVCKEKLPTNMPAKRLYVDAGSKLFISTLRNVPVLAPTMQALVSREVRETSLASMLGEPHKDEEEGLHQPEPEEEIPEAEQDRAKALVAAHVKKRKLYRQLTGQEVPWFPHDNAPELLKELCWEAGKPRWVLHGTPAAGAGLLGCLELGCSVVGLCWDEHHREHMSRNLLERAVESMVAGTTNVFKDEALQARSLELKLAPPPSKKDKKVKKSKKDKKQAAEEDEKDKTPKKDRKENKGKKDDDPKKDPKKEDDNDSDSSASSSGSSSSSGSKSIGEGQPRRKKPRKDA